MTRNLLLFSVGFNAAGLVLFCWMATKHPLTRSHVAAYDRVPKIL